MKKYSVFLIVSFFLVANLMSQPQYYTSNTGTSSNSFPFNMSPGKAVNSLILAGEFSLPAPLPSGQQITKVYFRTSSAGTRTYTNLHILMAQDVITTLTTGQFYAGPWDTVFFKASQELTSTAGGWMMITLDTPFPYDPAKSLIVFVGQCGYTGTGASIYNSILSGIRRVWSVGGCPFVPYASGDGSLMNFGVDVVPVPVPPTAPDYFYFKFENNPTSTTVLNCAYPGVGTNPATIANVTLTPGGQFDTCITGTGLTNGGITTGWNWNLGSGSWTVSMWLTIPSTSSGSAFYLFGDVGSGSFRCFHNGVAYPDNLIIRATGMTDVTVTGIGPAPTVVTIVYDSVAHNIKGYKNGVLANTVSNTLNMTTGTGFKIGGYSTSATYIGKMDEFRLYHRALDTAEISATWNMDIACALVTGIGINKNAIPNKYVLYQNYPNPFNPVTQISFGLLVAGNIKLSVFDMLGREVAVLYNGYRTSGTHSIEFNASNFASGVYFYKITAGDFTETKKMILIK